MDEKRNVEIKAQLFDPDTVIKIAKQLSTEQEEVIKQKDVYFHAPTGRLKLRVFPDNTSQLVYYNRPNTQEPKLSTYSTCDLPANVTNNMESLLKVVHGLRGVVSKTRLLFKVGQTRVHVDHVEALGDYFELEVVLEPHQTLKDGQTIADNLMSVFGIKSDHLVSVSYIDMLENIGK